LGENANVLEYLACQLSCLRGFLASHVAAESTRRGEFAQSVTDHVLGNIDWDVSASIMDGNGVSNHLGKDHACTTPSPQDLLLAFLVHRFYSFQ